MKFTMYKKETTDKKYSENPYRAVNFTKDADGNLICSNGQKFLFKRTQPVKYSKYGRTEELYECESCEGCPHKQECCPRAHKNRTIRMNQELTAIHQEVLNNLTSIHGALLRMNRSIQSERTFGVLKWDKSYKRLFRRGEKNVILELTLISCGFNLYKYHNKKQRQMKVSLKFKRDWLRLIKYTIFSTKRCMYEQKWEDSYKETPVPANAGSGVS